VTVLLVAGGFTPDIPALLVGIAVPLGIILILGLIAAVVLAVVLIRKKRRSRVNYLNETVSEQNVNLSHAERTYVNADSSCDNMSMLQKGSSTYQNTEMVEIKANTYENDDNKRNSNSEYQNVDDNEDAKNNYHYIKEEVSKEYKEILLTMNNFNNGHEIVIAQTKKFTIYGFRQCP